ncbi:MAG: hypothetical protein L0227_18675, partial [Chloroflexi bacterium]|nr:hypothetical protein [Chloroflexota bacterium]
MESLEARRLLSAEVVDGQLNILGTLVEDSIVVEAGPNDGEVTVTGVDGVADGTTFQGIDSVRIDLLTGSDTAEVAGALRTTAGDPMTVRMFGGFGNDTLIGGDSFDLLFGGPGWDTLQGNERADLLIGGGHRDWLFGGEGPDLLAGNTGPDHLFGGLGNDAMFGGIGHDQLFGGAGNDLMGGQLGFDYIHGGINDDVIGGGGHADVLRGGA